MISCIIPYYENNTPEESVYLGRCFSSLYDSAKLCSEEVEILIAYNTSDQGRVWAKNTYAEKAKGDTLVFVDCDCTVGSNFFEEISIKATSAVGGGVKYPRVTRLSLGILLFGLSLRLYFLIRRIDVGAFWIKKAAFKAMGGFRNKKYDDIDFALRLKKYARKTKQMTASLKDSYIIWSTRKFDTFGDWHWIYRGYDPNKAD